MKKTIVILLVICGVLSGTSQVCFAVGGKAAANDVPKGAVIIGFIDSGIAPCNLDESHILEGKNYVFETADTVDRIGHGTKTAGMVLGSSDGSVEGICPDAYAVPLVVVDKYPSGLSCNGGTEALVSAIYDAVDVFGCGIINISLCQRKGGDELKEAVDYACSKGVILVCAAGNYGDSEGLYYPAHYDNVITVGSSAGDEIADFSQTGDTDFYYEGESVPVVSYKENGKVSMDSGTSYSCASVAGICASLLEEARAMAEGTASGLEKSPISLGEPTTLLAGTSYPILDAMRMLLRERCIEGTSILRSASEAAAGETSDTDHKTEGAVDFSETDDHKTEGAAGFIDTDGHWAEAAIDYCVTRGIFHGGSDGIFLPDAKMTRAMFVTVLWNMAGNPETEYRAGFSDVAENAWYSEAVDWAYENGLISGTSANTFAPGSNISREQVCVLLSHYAAFTGHALKIEIQVSSPDTKIPVHFSDEESISSWAKAAVESCTSAGIIHGYPNQKIGPRGDATRAECCAILQNYCTAVE